MTNANLPLGYLRSATRRLETLPILKDSGGYNDVVREAQEIVELALKAILRWIGKDPPHRHDVGPEIIQYLNHLDNAVHDEARLVAAASKHLRKDRELAFYGADDFVPDESYTPDEADIARDWAIRAVRLANLVIGAP